LDKRSQLTDRNWYSVVWNNDGIFVAVSYTGTDWQVMKSSNGTTWTRENVGISQGWIHVCWKPSTSLFLALNNQAGTTNRTMTCPDGGVTWTGRNIPQDMDIRSCVWAPALNMFVIVASSY
jgi:hypothetical protein